MMIVSDKNQEYFISGKPALKETLMRDLWSEKIIYILKGITEMQEEIKHTKSKGKHIDEYKCTSTDNDCVEQ